MKVQTLKRLDSYTLHVAACEGAVALRAAGASQELVIALTQRMKKLKDQTIRIKLGIPLHPPSKTNRERVGVPK